MIILGVVFRCLEVTLTAAACLSSKPLFLAPLDKREEATTYGELPMVITCVLTNIQAESEIFDCRERCIDGCCSIRGLWKGPFRRKIEQCPQYVLWGGPMIYSLY